MDYKSAAQTEQHLGGGKKFPILIQQGINKKADQDSKSEKPKNDERKSIVAQWEATSKIFKSFTRPKKMKMAPPLPPAKGTPRQVSRITFKKLEESPEPSWAFGSSTTMFTNEKSQTFQFSEDEKKLRVCNLEDEDKPRQIKHDEVVKTSFNSTSVEKGNKNGLNHPAEYSVGLLHKNNCHSLNLTGSLLQTDSSREDNISAMSNMSSMIQPSVGYNWALQDKTRIDSCGKATALSKGIDMLNEVKPSARRISEESETNSSESPNTFPCKDTVSEIFSDRFSFHTDPSLFLEKFRGNSDSGFQDAALNGITPFKEPIGNESKQWLCRNEANVNAVGPFLEDDGNKYLVTFGTGKSERSTTSSGVDEITKISSSEKETDNNTILPEQSITSYSSAKPTKEADTLMTPSAKLNYAIDQKLPTPSIENSFRRSNAQVPKFPQSAQQTENKAYNMSALKVKAQIPESFNSPCSNLTNSSSLIRQRKGATNMATIGSCSTTKKHKVAFIKKRRYKVLALLGKGGSSKVYEVEDDHGQKFGLKCVQMDNLDDFVFESYLNEIQILQDLKDDPNIITLYDYEIKKEVLYMLMEKGGMDLEKYLHSNRKMSFDQIRSTWKQMLCVVRSIHEQGIIHTDLKPANFLFIDSVLKLIDFGIAKGLTDNCTSAQRDCLIGTLNYMAPESIGDCDNQDRYADDGMKKNYKIRRATDIWSLGCILYLMAYGKTPFQHIKNRLSKMVAITKVKDVSYPDIGNEDLVDTIKGCLKRNLRERYTIDQLLAHPFVTGAHSPIDESNATQNAEPVNKRDLESFITNAKSLFVNSPNSLDRTKKTLARRALIGLDGMNPSRKAIFQ